MLVLYDPGTLQHETIELLGSKLIPALESPQRITSIVSAIERSSHGLVTIHYADSAESAGGEQSPVQRLVAKSHDENYLRHLRNIHQESTQRGLIESHETLLPECFPVARLSRHQDGQRNLDCPPKDIHAQSGFYSFDMSAGISTGTWFSAVASANLAVQAVQYVTQRDSNRPKSVMALCRPPGHHCTTRLAGGYCYINNAVVAVDAFRTQHMSSSESDRPRVAILDLDFHHGNGTQDYFYTEPSVLYTSLHGLDEYPYYSGGARELGEGDGIGCNCNFPLPAGTDAATYLATLETALSRIASYGPSYLVVSLGFDTFELDPLGSFQLSTEHYCEIADKVRSRAEIKSIPSVILLEGGYVVEHLGANVDSFLRGWQTAEECGRSGLAPDLT